MTGTPSQGEKETVAQMIVVSPVLLLLVFDTQDVSRIGEDSIIV